MNSYLHAPLILAARAHRGQVDKQGLPYILHVLRVMVAVDEPNDRIVALLHDVVEDTDWTIEKLNIEGYDDVIIGAVDAITRKEGETYRAYIERVKKNPIARRVKIADLRDNLGRIDGILDPLKRQELGRRYKRALETLVDEAVAVGVV